MSMIPFNRTHIVGDIVFAARGGSIHSFRLSDGKHVSTWQHPDVSRRHDAQATLDQPLDVGNASTETVDARQPPVKRQKLESGRDRLDSSTGHDVHASGPAAEGDVFEAQVNRNGGVAGERNGKTIKKKTKTRTENHAHQVARAPDRPLITQMTSSADGRHVLAVSGHDKAMLVFEHDGLGRLTQKSQRTMPKRPSAVVVADDGQIVCADKFGDVYALPLVPPSGLPSSIPSTPRPPSVQPPARPAGMEASTLTVHSKRNREALDNQRKQLELQKQRRQEPPARALVPDFELILLLGHISMLTALVLAESEGRMYILTADRDEHIRVSRYIPHAHIIEGFCLGHRSFVSDMVVPPLRRDVLISGGGDDELLVWDWKAGTVHSRANILTLVKTIAPEATHVAVSGLFTLLYPSGVDKLTYILAICEDITAIFSWQLTDANVLSHPAITELPGSPIHLSCSTRGPGNALPMLIVAMHQGQTPSQSLHVFNLTINAGRLAVDTESSLQEPQLEADEMNVSENEIRRLLFTVENLRKHIGGDDNEPAVAEAADDVEVNPTSARGDV